MGVFAGHDPKSLGAVCDPSDFSEVLRIPVGVLGPGLNDGTITDDLVAPGEELIAALPDGAQFARHVFKDRVPWVVVSVHAHDAAA